MCQAQSCPQATHPEPPLPLPSQGPRGEDAARQQAWEEAGSRCPVAPSLN